MSIPANVLNGKGEFDNEKFVRCPCCKSVHCPEDNHDEFWDNRLIIHQCEECEEWFEFHSYVTTSFNFTSPPLAMQEKHQGQQKNRGRIMPCHKLPGGHLCTGDPTRSITVLGRVYRFEMHPRCGPIPLNKNGSVRKNDWPIDVWHDVDVWVKQGEKIDEDGNCLIDVK